MKKSILLVSGLILCGALFAQDFPYKNPALSPEQRADDLISRLSIEQKVSLMMNTSPAIPEFGIREYDWWSESLHGCARAGIATMFPQAIGMAASWDDVLLEKVFTVASDEHRIKYKIARREGNVRRYHGLTVWTPNINIFRDPRWGRGQETYGEDPYLTSRMGYAVVTGLQGTKSADGYDKLHACLKHYAVHSGPEGTRHSFDVEDLSYKDLMETYLYAFERIIKTTDVQEVMCAYNRFDGQPCCGSDQLLVQLLRDKWGYKGLVTSDCGAIDDFWKPGRHENFLNDPTSAVANAVRTGTDVECGSSYKHLLDAWKEGKITEDEINVSLRRLFIARFRLGEMDPDEMVSWNSIPEDRLACDESRALSLKMARETMVLLQNRGKRLPLAKTGVKYAVIGPNADNERVMWGNYNGTPVETITALEGIAAKVGADNVTTDAAEADIILFIGGISAQMEGEEMRYSPEGFNRGDRTTIEFPRNQRDTLKTLAALGKPIVLVNMSGSAMGLLPETGLCDAILQAWYAGEQGGNAIADVLFGDYNPSGKLPVTFYRSDDDLPDFNCYDMEGRTYRYFEGKPLWEFGFGLSYTKFKFGRARIKDGNLIVKVRNTGKMDGDEVVQVYVTKKGEKDGPKKALRGFQRVSVPAHGSVTVTIPLGDEAFKTYDDSVGEMTVTPGRFTVWYGNSSADRNLRKKHVRI
ncbi:MAG: glycoside hydrolase family 3 C-terminal domain-containing protein [Bacteroidales bacterium]|nr:glycoside hydrolase family 3 C-terminal domain-containing protein [Bacteroidales bacterium]